MPLEIPAFAAKQQGCLPLVVGTLQPAIEEFIFPALNRETDKITYSRMSDSVQKHPNSGPKHPLYYEASGSPIFADHVGSSVALLTVASLQ